MRVLLHEGLCVRCPSAHCPSLSLNPCAQGFSTGKARPTLQRIVVRTSIHDAEPLGNSYSDAEYVPRRR